MIKNDIVIKEPSAEHEDIIYELVCELEHERLDREAFSKVYRHNLSDPNVYYLLAIDSSDIIGFGSLHIQQLLHHCYTPVGEVQELVVTERYQGSGIGTLLMDRIKEIAVENDCKLLEVCFNKVRENSLMFYERQGMEKSHFKFTLIL